MDWRSHPEFVDGCLIVGHAPKLVGAAVRIEVEDVRFLDVHVLAWPVGPVGLEPHERDRMRVVGEYLVEGQLHCVAGSLFEHSELLDDLLAACRTLSPR